MSSKPSNQKTILSEAFISFSGMTLGSVFRYIFSIVMARFLGAQMLGIYSLGNAVVRIAEIFALMGLDSGVLRFVSRDTKNKKNVKNSINSSLKMGLISSLVSATALFLSAEWIVFKVLDEESFLITVIKVYAFSLPFCIPLLIASSSTQAFKTMKYKILVEHIVNPFTHVWAFIVSYIYFGDKLAVLAPPLLSPIIGLILILIFLKKFTDLKFINFLKTPIDKKILMFSAPLMFVSVVGIMMHWVDIIMLGILSSAIDVGMYHPIDRTAGLVRMILFAFAGIFAPIFSEHYFNKDIAGMKESYKSSSKYILMFSFPVFIFLFVFSSPMLLLFGSEFDNALALKILLTGIFIQTIFGLGSSTLTMSGNTLFNLMNVSIALILNISLNYLLIPQYGIIGAALSTAIALFILSILRFIENIVLMKLNLLSIRLIKPIISGIFTFLIYTNTKDLFLDLFSLDNILGLLFYLLIHFILVFLTYFLIYFLMGFDEEDKELINSFKTKLI